MALLQKSEPHRAVNVAHFLSFIEDLGASLVDSNLDGVDTDLLVQNDGLFRQELTLLLKDVVHRVRVDISEPLVFTNHSTTTHPLLDLLAACRVSPELSAEFTWFDDPPVDFANQYYVLTFRRTIQASAVAQELEGRGYRGATLRETLVVLREYPHILSQYGHFIISGSSFKPDVWNENHALFSLKRLGERVAVSPVFEHYFFRADTEHIIISANAGPNVKTS